MDSNAHLRLRTLLFLQLIVQAQTQMSSDGSPSNNILSKPEHILSFIKHALQNNAMLQDSAPKQRAQNSVASPGLTMDDLRIVRRDEQLEDEDLDTGGDSDDERPESEGGQPDDEMTITALNLLLSLLEGNSFYFTVVSPTHCAHQQIRTSLYSQLPPSRMSSKMRSASSRPLLNLFAHLPVKHGWCSQSVSHPPRRPLQSPLVWSLRRIGSGPCTRERSSFFKIPYFLFERMACCSCESW
jgi:hypothetical protein